VQDESADAPKAEDASALRGLFLGCPLWGFQGWIGEGRTPFVMVHCPNSRHVPALARRLHELLIDRELDVGELPPWPSERAEGDGDQLLLFPA
jgi:hypothetical protein